ncbi:uncharacterized protein LOC129905361 [Episyrphus balteatus]|uniref:uncharacterized protein LOC129905361 n=1 Tax=Episyrphus balteatus TaxID=286459 RepID=UPI0024853008|nr:uncharacterized protein LOC129905361 [Episyrphus balteatus]
MSAITKLDETFLLEEIEQPAMKLDSSQLAREVKKYPILYDNNLRREQTAIFNAWESVCSEMVPSYYNMTENDKLATRKRLKDRWGYMRSTFRRDIYTNNIDCHKGLDWIQEIQFLVPILTRPIERSICTRSRALSKNTPITKIATTLNISFKSDTSSIYIFNKVEEEDHTLSKSQTASSFINKPSVTESDLINNPSSVETDLISNPSSFTNETDILNDSELFANETFSSIPDNIFSSDSSISDKSTLDTSSISTDISDDDKSHNDLMVETFMSTFSLDSNLTPPADPDQMFLLTLLQNYRLVREENKELLQHKFYTFLRD